MNGFLVDDPSYIAKLFRATGGHEVRHLDSVTYGHFEDLTDELFADQAGALVFDAVLTIATRSLPGIGPELPSGTVKGIGERISTSGPTGAFEWKILNIRDGSSAGEIRLFLSSE